MNAAGRRRGVKGLRDEGIRVPRSRDASPRLRDTDVLTRGCWIGKRREFCFEENVGSLGDTGMEEITIKVYIP